MPLTKAERQARAAIASINNTVVGEVPKGFNGKYHPLPDMLNVAVPLWQLEYRCLPWDTRKQMLIEQGEILSRLEEAVLFKTKPGESAKAFNALAKIVALLSMVPHGVTCFGVEWKCEAENA